MKRNKRTETVGFQTRLPIMPSKKVMENNKTKSMSRRSLKQETRRLAESEK